MGNKWVITISDSKGEIYKSKHSDKEKINHIFLVAFSRGWDFSMRRLDDPED